ncbi:winged helix-turn-helix domain-containing protein [Erythrobacter alti]|uniref:winged helix-turn-helix domain-containing protein n=1 Tax=Erythrobacter alti TaxID=1896145 RepID=UPI0030F49191
MEKQPDILCFDAFTLDLANRQLFNAGKPVELGSRYFDALVLLARESGNLITKDRFLEEVWRGIPVTDEALTQCIRTLRKALADDAAHPRFIATVPKHGYRFIAPMEARATPARDHGKVVPAHLAGTCTFAGCVAGALGGMFYALIAGQGSIGGAIALAGLVGALGTMAGAGIGVTLAGILAWRHGPDGWLPVGGLLGGSVVGAVGSVLGRDGVALLTGSSIQGATGAFEGAILGLAAGAAVWLVLRGAGSYAWPLLASALIGAAAGGVIEISGGPMLGGSLANLQASLGNAGLDIHLVGQALGESGFGPLARFTTASVEASVFVTAMALAALAAMHKSGT